MKYQVQTALNFKPILLITLYYYPIFKLPIFSSQLIYSLLSIIKPNYPQLDSHKIWIMPVNNKKNIKAV